MKKIVICVMLCLCSMLSGCQTELTEPPALLEPAGVKADLVTVEKGDIKRISAYDGEIVPYVEEVSFDMDGKFGEFKVMQGDKVEKGQVLAVLDDEAAQEAVDALEAEVYDINRMGEFQDHQTKADIEIAKLTLSKMQNEGASKEDCEIQKMEIDLLESKLEQAGQLRNLELQQKYAALEKLRSNIEEMSIVAPFDGTIVFQQSLSSGDFIRNNTTVVCVADTTQLWISTAAIDSVKLKNAESCYAQIDGKKYSVTYSPYDRGEYLSLVFSGETVHSKFTFDELPKNLKCGEYVQIILVQRQMENVLTVPINALYEDKTGSYVYKQFEDRRVRCDVKVGFKSDTEAEIITGLQEGDTVYVKE